MWAGCGVGVAVAVEVEVEVDVDVDVGVEVDVDVDLFRTIEASLFVVLMDDEFFVAARCENRPPCCTLLEDADDSLAID